MSAASPTDWSRQVLHLDLRVEGGWAEAFLNDLPICRASDAAPDAPGGGRYPLRSCQPVQHAVTSGENRLRVVLAPTIPGEPVADAARASARLVWVGDGEVQSADDGRVIAEALVAPISPAGQALDGRAPESRTLRALTATTTLDLGPALGQPAWCDASILSITESLLDEAEGAVRDYAAALETGDATRLLALLETFAVDYLRAYPTMDRSTVDDMHAEVARAFRGGHVEIAPRATWIPRLVGGGRVLDLRRHDGEPAVVHHQPDGLDSVVPFMLAWVDGILLHLG